MVSSLQAHLSSALFARSMPSTINRRAGGHPQGRLSAASQTGSASTREPSEPAPAAMSRVASGRGGRQSRLAESRHLKQAVVLLARRLRRRQRVRSLRQAGLAMIDERQRASALSLAPYPLAPCRIAHLRCSPRSRMPPRQTWCPLWAKRPGRSPWPGTGPRLMWPLASHRLRPPRQAPPRPASKPWRDV